LAPTFDIGLAGRIEVLVFSGAFLSVGVGVGVGVVHHVVVVCSPLATLSFVFLSWAKLKSCMHCLNFIICALHLAKDRSLSAKHNSNSS
jgi:hypothetical protein